MTEKTNTQDEGNSPNHFLSIKSLLNHLGFKPIESNDKESFYSNIFKAPKFVPKGFRLDHALDAWFDKTLGKGGNIVDFAKHYWPTLDPDEIHEKLASISDNFKYHHLFPIKERPKRKRKPIKLPHYQVDRIRKLELSCEVFDFLNESNLWEFADSNLVEVHYYFIDQMGKRKDFCAAGWPNENGGWELYAKNFRSCIGPKGMSIFQASTRNITIFQEFTDYLKNRDQLYALYSSILVLNTPQFISAAIKRAGKYNNVRFYLDEKREGYKEAKIEVQGSLPNCIFLPL